MKYKTLTNLNMVIKFLLFFTLFFVTIITQSTSKMDFCDLEHCNFEGICVMTDEQPPTPKCECIKSVYIGDKCDTMVDYCKMTNLCKNSLSCTPFPSAYSCQCDAQHAGQFCDLSNKHFRDFRFYYNRIMNVNEINYILLTFESLGIVETTLEITTPNYIIESFSFPNRGPTFLKETNDVQHVAKSLGIKSVALIPNSKALYVVSEVMMVDSGPVKMKVTLVDSDNADEYYDRVVDIHVIKNEQQCYPIITNYQW